MAKQTIYSLIIVITGHGSVSEFQLSSAGPLITISGIQATQRLSCRRGEATGAVEDATPPLSPLKRHWDFSGLLIDACNCLSQNAGSCQGRSICL